MNISDLASMPGALIRLNTVCHFGRKYLNECTAFAGEESKAEDKLSVHHFVCMLES